MKHLIVSSVLILIHAIVLSLFSIGYEQEVGGYLKQAADSNSTALAEAKLQQAIEGMNARGLCNEGEDNCYTSVIYRTPQDDVNYWRTNIESTLEDLQSMTEEERNNNLIESNQLIKVRETLLDNSDRGDVVTDPPGISRYPHNKFLAGIWFLLSCYFLYGSWVFMRE
jgi:hypothetical protein